jgi:predicted O-methyltransferase YrrM
MHLLREYINYIRKAQGRHQIHSPFVYDFVDRCLRINLSSDFQQKFKHLKKSILANKTLLHTQDFGAGSKKMKEQRTVSETFKNASCKGTYAQLLYQLSSHYQPKKILELGTNLGIGTFHLHGGNPIAKVVSIDGCSETQEIAKKHLKSENIQFITNTFDEALNNLKPSTFDLIYIDGDHRGESLIRYLNKLNEFSHDETIFVLDDIRWSKDMFETWIQLKNSSDFHLSMDLFKMGILIPKKGKEKEHFIIRLKNVLTSL